MTSSIQKILVPFFVLFLSAVSSYSQPLLTTLRVDSVLSSYIAEWNSMNSVELHVKNTTDSTVVFKLESTVLLQGKPLATAPTVVTDRFTLAPRADTTIPSAKIFPVLKMSYFEKQRIDKRSGMISRGGDITICINLFDTTGLHGLSQANCIHRNILPYEVAELVHPPANDSVGQGDTIQFRWKSVRPLPKHCRYEFHLYAAGHETYPAQVVRTAIPVVDTVLNDTTAYTWSVPDSLRGGRMVWQIHTTNGMGLHYGGTDGYSEIHQFLLRQRVVKGSKAAKPTKTKTSSKQPAIKAAKKK